MTITVEIPTDIERQIQRNIARGDTQAARQLLFETISPTIEAAIINNAAQPPELSYEEFKALADKLADLAEEYIGHDFQPLSDYATSRESFYVGRPKL